MLNYTIEEIRKQIDFINEKDEIELILEGYSGAITLRIIRKEENYFLKILKNKENAVERIKEIIKIYQDNDIRIPRLIEAGEMKDKLGYYCLYEFIEGENARSLPGKKPISFFYDMGKEIGKKVTRIINNKEETSYIEENKEIDKRVKEAEKDFKDLYQKEKKLIHQYFSEEELKAINDKLFQTIEAFREERKMLIYTDIKLGNILIDEKGKIVIVDIEGTKYDYPIFCLGWSLAPFSDKQGKECKALHKGVIEVLAKEGNYSEEQMLFSYILKSYQKLSDIYKKEKEKLAYWLAWVRRAYEETDGFRKGIF